MKNIALILVVAATALAVLYVAMPKSNQQPTETETPEQNENGQAPAVEVVAEGLEIPWDIAFLPGGEMLVTERTGHVIEIKTDGTKREIKIEGVSQGGEGGLLGLVLHPDFAFNHFVYLYMSAPGGAGQTQNKVVRYKYLDGKLMEDKVIIEGIPGAIYHDGGRMEFGPDERLYITTGDATNAAIAQDLQSLGGKILRLQDDGVIPTDNPFQSAVWSYGHRNPQGLAWDSAGRLWETEHGRSGVTSGLDEINLIEAGANYGWPESEGDTVQPGTVTPARHSGATDTWAPASLAYLNGSLFFGGLRGEALYEAVLSGTHIVEFKEHFKNEFGRIRTVRVGLNGMLYLTTSNTDGRDSPNTGDDKIIKINPELL
ncbi:MAG: PQQ-dependent sugar dehydrogenase [Patescibacteria group bacterium]|nr:PQQ-dependent sugar dehydrogenase [Patescibacteria group bacterium]